MNNQLFKVSIVITSVLTIFVLIITIIVFFAKDANEYNLDKIAIENQIDDSMQFSALSRSNIEEEHRKKLSESSLIAENYLDSLVNEEIVWGYKIENVKENSIYVTHKNRYNDLIYSNDVEMLKTLKKGDIILVHGKIQSVASLLGYTVKIDLIELKKS